VPALLNIRIWAFPKAFVELIKLADTQIQRLQNMSAETFAPMVAMNRDGLVQR
jgi:hypothetical protein